MQRHVVRPHRTGCIRRITMLVYEPLCRRAYSQYVLRLVNRDAESRRRRLTGAPPDRREGHIDRSTRQETFVQASSTFLADDLSNGGP